MRACLNVGTDPGVGAEDNPDGFSNVYESGASGANSAAPSIYEVASTGETPMSIAKAVWGDGNLWYLIAEANGLAGNDSLAAGQILRLPARINTLHNDYTSYKPYNPADAIGSTMPNVPPPAAAAGGCGTVGMIIMIVVAIVVTIYTAGAAASSMPAATAAAGGTVATGAAAGTAASAWSVGLSVMGGSSGLGLGTVMLAGAAGGAAGSIASQLVGMAMGNVDKFSWSSVAAGAIGGAVTAGVGAALRPEGALFLQGSGVTAKAAQAAIASALTQGINSAVKVQEGFSWRNVAAAGIASTVGQVIGGRVTQSFGWMGETAGGMAGGAATAIIAGATARKLTGGKVDYRQLATDAFGNALGNSLVEAAHSSTRAEQLADDQMRSGREEAAIQNEVWEKAAANRLRESMLEGIVAADGDERTLGAEAGDDEFEGASGSVGGPNPLRPGGRHNAEFNRRFLSSHETEALLTSTPDFLKTQHRQLGVAYEEIIRKNLKLAGHLPAAIADQNEMISSQATGMLLLAATYNVDPSSRQAIQLSLGMENYGYTTEYQGAKEFVTELSRKLGRFSEEGHSMKYFAPYLTTQTAPLFERNYKSNGEYRANYDNLIGVADTAGARLSLAAPSLAIGLILTAMSGRVASMASPQGVSRGEFTKFGKALRDVLSKENLPQGRTYVHGSRANNTSRPGESDLDVIHVVSDADFDALVAKRMTETSGKSLKQLIQYAEKQERLPARSISHTLAPNLWENVYHPTLPKTVTNIQFSIAKASSPYNTGPFIRVPGSR